MIWSTPDSKKVNTFGGLIMKSLVLYSSKSGNTKKLAEALYNHLSGEKELFALADAPDPTGYTFIALGFWLKGGQPDPDSQVYLARMEEGQDLYLFATHGAAADSPHAQNAMNKAKALAAKAHIVATFSCPGQVAEKVLEKAAKKDPQPPWLADAPAAAGHPDEKDLENVVRMLVELDLP